MDIKRLLPHTFGSNCYIVTINNESIIIDPSVNLETIKKELGDNKLKAILLTHGHFDHILSLDELLDYFEVPLYLHRNALEKIQDPAKNYSFMAGEEIAINLEKYKYKLVNNLDELMIFSTLPVKVYTTFGHTNCSICFLIDDNLFTGDTLFKGTVGRTDLYTGDKNVLKESLKIFKTFPDNFKIYPGHEGSSTIKEEKKFNLYLK